MGVRETSIDVYNQIKSEGLLSKRRLEVLAVLAQADWPLTASEIFERMGKHSHMHQTRARLNELRESGAVDECAPRECSISGRRVLTWKMSGKLPIKVKRETEKQRLKRENLELRKAVAELKIRNNDLVKRIGELAARDTVASMQRELFQN